MFAGRLKVRRLSGRLMVSSAVDLVRQNSRMPSSPWIRPNPDSPIPPNGKDGMPAKPITEFTLVIPARIWSASSRALAEHRRAEPVAAVVGEPHRLLGRADPRDRD